MFLIRVCPPLRAGSVAEAFGEAGADIVGEALQVLVNVVNKVEGIVSQERRQVHREPEPARGQPLNIKY